MVYFVALEIIPGQLDLTSGVYINVVFFLSNFMP